MKNSKPVRPWRIKKSKNKGRVTGDKGVNYPPEADQPFPPWAGLAEKLTTPEAGEKLKKIIYSLCCLSLRVFSLVQMTLVLNIEDHYKWF